MNVFYVYEHWRTDRDECFYVGKGKGKRAYNMSWRNPHHKAVQNKVIREGFAIEVKIVASGLTEDAAFKLEMERIAFWRSVKIDLTNITNGGEGVSGKPAYNRKPVICLEDGNIFESCQAAGKFYNTTSSSVSEACNGKNRTANNLHFSFVNEPLRSIKEIENYHAKRRKKVNCPKNLYHNIFEGKDIAGRNATGPIKNSKKVICLEDGLKYPSASAAARHYNLSKSAIIELCLGKNNRKTVGGLKFKYVENV